MSLKSQPEHFELQLRHVSSLLPRVNPELSKVHVKREVHELLREVSDGENIKSDSDSDGSSPVVRSHPPVVANLEGVEDVGDVDWAGPRG